MARIHPTVAVFVLLAVVALAGAVGVFAPASAASVEDSTEANLSGPDTTASQSDNPSVASQTDNTSVAIQASRNDTIAHTPVTLRTGGQFDAHDWEITRAPAGSDPDLREIEPGTVSLQPPAPGEYEVRVTVGAADGDAARATDSVTIEARNRTAALAEFAPRLHFHADAPYRPTRIEALFENAALRHDSAGTVAEAPLTAFDVAGRDGDHSLSLSDQSAPYHETFEPTVYANHVGNVSFEGETYDALNYWFVYTNDPKHGFATFGAHQGDVERTSILLDGNGDPAYVLPAAHGGQTVAPYDQWAGPDGRIDLYPEHRSHASYLRDSAAYEGDGFQVYEFWGDATADCGALSRFESTFYSERTGSAETWSPTGETGTDYRLVELDGGERWGTYAGGLAASPGSITVPHDRAVFDAPAERFGAACSDREQVRGSLSVEDVSLDGNSSTVDVTVRNAGGKPHTFWVTVEDGDGAVLGSESVAVGTTRWRLVEGESSATVVFDYDGQADVTAELWLHPPATRAAGDRKDAVTIVADGAVVAGGFDVPFGVTVLAGVAVVTGLSYLYRRRRYH